MKANTKETKNPALESLEGLYLDQLRDIYSAENQLIKALPKMAKAAQSEELKMEFEEHLEQTKTHAERLEQIFEELGEKPGREKCEAMEGLVKEGAEAIQKDEENPAIKDVGLIAAAQRVEHYEIAAYGTVRTFAEKLGYSDAVDLLQQTLDEEAETDTKLTEISETLLGEDFAQESEEDSDSEDSDEA